MKANRAALGLVPLRALSPEVRALAVDGCSVLSAREPCAGLSVTVWLGIRADASDVEEASLTRDLRAAMAPLDPPAVRLVAAGDIIIGRKVDERIVALRDYLSPFRQVAPELESADITVADVEMPMSDRITPSHDWKTFTFGTSTKAVEGLTLRRIRRRVAREQPHDESRTGRVRRHADDTRPRGDPLLRRRSGTTPRRTGRP